MNFKDILNADLETVSLWIRRGLTWWLEELSQVLPENWRRRFATRPDLVAELGNGDIVVRGKGGAVLQPAGLSRRERGSVRLVLPLSSVLTRTLEFPLLPISDIRRMVALEIDRFTPFRPEAVVFDTELIRRDQEKGRQQVLLGVLPKSAGRDAVTRAQKLGLAPSALCASSGVGSNTHFDFLPPLEGTAGRMGARARLPYWWAAVGLLIVLNLALLSWRDETALDGLQQIVDSQSETVQVALKLRDKVDLESARRTALVRRMGETSPLRIVEAVTNALPDDAWTQTFEWNGASVHLAGYSSTPTDVLKAINASPLLHNARSMNHGAQQPAKATGMQPFDISADARRGASP